MHVGGGVGRVLELLGDEGPGVRVAQLLRLAYGAGHAFASRREHQPCAEGLQQLAAFEAHGLRHGEDERVAFDGGDPGQPDARVAAGGFDDKASGAEPSVALRRLDQAECGPVLHASAGIEAFQFHEDAGGQPFLLLYVGDFQQGRVADQFGQRAINLFHVAVLC